MTRGSSPLALPAPVARSAPRRDEDPAVGLPGLSSAATISREVGYTVVSLLGEHDIATREELTDTMAVAIALNGDDVVVDLSGVEFMGAATIHVIARAEAFLRRRSRALTLRSPSNCARRVVDVCGLAALVETAPAERHGATALGRVRRLA